jgi:hypothetical protein
MPNQTRQATPGTVSGRSGHLRPGVAGLIVSMKRIPTSGGCYCGKVRFKATQEPIDQTNCHCANCRRAIGAQSVAWITVNRSDFQYERGSPKRFRTDTGAWRSFCDVCGTSLTYERDTRPKEIDITTGSLDHPEDFPPRKDFYSEERLPWVHLLDDTKC